MEQASRLCHLLHFFLLVSCFPWFFLRRWQVLVWSCIILWCNSFVYYFFLFSSHSSSFSQHRFIFYMICIIIFDLFLKLLFHLFIFTFIIYTIWLKKGTVARNCFNIRSTSCVCLLVLRWKRGRELVHCLSKKSRHLYSFKVAPSFWFLNINMPIFLLKPFPNCHRKTWFKFLGGSPSKCWPNSMPVFVCIAIGKSGFLKIKSQNGRWPQLFSPKVCSVKPVLAEELNKSGCLCSKYLTSLLRHVYVNRLVWT